MGGVRGRPPHLNLDKLLPAAIAAASTSTSSATTATAGPSAAAAVSTTAAAGSALLTRAGFGHLDPPALKFRIV
jgi:hypothetical protein